jgi:hypothetical protein
MSIYYLHSSAGAGCVAAAATDAHFLCLWGGLTVASDSYELPCDGFLVVIIALFLRELVMD